ncbi:MAG: serine/threonine protein kinase [Planctomycetota bacterium]
MAVFLVPGYTGLTSYKEGGGSYVLKGQRKADGEIVAVKVLKPEAARDKEQMQAFTQEADILSQLRCRSVIRVYEYVSSAKPLPAIVMEYFPSENLKVLMYEKTDFVRQHWHRILYEISGALMYIHKRGIVHRDMKPENVLVSSDGLAKLIDFSLAITKARKPRKIQGTPSYIAPEQIMRGKVTPLTDIYSFGVMIYELLTGAAPFVGKTTNEVLDQHLKTLPIHVSKRCKGLDPGLASIVMRMLAKEPRNRPPDITELLALLKTTDRAPLAG